MSAPFEPSTLIGRCACGAALTAWHLQFSCPLTLQPQEISKELRGLVMNRAVFESRFDVEHVVVLGEN